MKNTIILLIDFEGEKELQDQNYLNSRYVALLDILQQRKINREKCIVVFNTYNKLDTLSDTPNEWEKIEEPQLSKLCKFAWLEKWHVFNTTKETEMGFKDIDIETFIKVIRDKKPNFNIHPNKTNIIIGGTETAGCVLSNKKLGALNWSKRSYDTTIYLPLCAEYSSMGNTWYEKQQSAFASFWSKMKKCDPNDYKTLNIVNEFRELSLPWAQTGIKPLQLDKGCKL